MKPSVYVPGVTSLGTQTLDWNNDGTLKSDTNSTKSTVSSYIYDADGNLLIQEDPGTTTLYLSGEQIAYNTSTSAATGVRTYSLPGGATAVRTGTGSNYDFEVSSDQHGTNTLYLNSTCQTPTWRQQDPYGNTRGTAVTWIDNRSFLDKVDDTSTGLILIGARWYDPTTGSFISLDPVLETKDPTQPGDDPVSSSDPTGEYGRPIACADGPAGSVPPRADTARPAAFRRSTTRARNIPPCVRTIREARCSTRSITM